MTRSPWSRPLGGALVLILSFSLGACAGGGLTPSGGSASAMPTVAASDSLPPFACTASVTTAATTDRAQIIDVRVGAHEGYDRVVIEFASGLPAAVVAAVLPPLSADPSDSPIEVAGSAFLKVTMHGASKVTPDGTVTYGGPTNFEPGFEQLVQLIEGGDFEAVSTWYVGLARSACTRVLTLGNPSRLVIDIRR